MQFLPSAAIGADAYCHRSLWPTGRPSVRPSVRPPARPALSSPALPCLALPCSAMRCAAIYHEADHCMKWPHSANVCIFWSRPAEGAVVLGTSCIINAVFTSITPRDHVTDNNNNSALVQVIGLVPSSNRPIPGPYWPRSISPYGITRSEWFNTSTFYIFPAFIWPDSDFYPQYALPELILM